MEKNLEKYGALILRLGFGVVLLAHGLLKVNVFTIAGTVGFFEKMGVPAAELAAYATIGFEVVGGALIIAGVFVRVLALASIPVMLGAIIFVHGGNGWLFSNQGGGWEFPAFLALIGVVLALVGKGAYALDLSVLTGRKPSSQPAA